MERKATRRSLPRDPRFWWSRLKLRWPFLVWLGAAALAVMFYMHGGRAGPMEGVVEARREEAAPLEAARLVEVLVEPGQDVKAGDILGRMDTTLLEAQMAVDQLQVSRQFSRSVAESETALRDAKIRQASDEAQREVLNQEIERMDSLLAQRLIDAQTVARFRVQAGALARAVELYPETIRILEDDVRLAKEQMAQVDQWLNGGTDAVHEADDVTTAAAQQRVGLLRMRREGYTLRARQAGTVSRVLHQPGDVVQAGDPVVVLVVQGTQEIIGFLPEWNALEVAVGSSAYLSRPSGIGPVFKAKVISLSPEIMGLPGRVSPIPGQTIRGRRLVLVTEEANNLLPGEAVSIHILRPWWSQLFGGKLSPPAAGEGIARSEPQP